MRSESRSARKKSGRWGRAAPRICKVIQARVGEGGPRRSQQRSTPRGPETAGGSQGDAPQRRARGSSLGAARVHETAGISQLNCDTGWKQCRPGGVNERPSRASRTGRARPETRRRTKPAACRTDGRTWTLWSPILWFSACERGSWTGPGRGRAGRSASPGARGSPKTRAQTAPAAGFWPVLRCWRLNATLGCRELLESGHTPSSLSDSAIRARRCKCQFTES